MSKIALSTLSLGVKAQERILEFLRELGHEKVSGNGEADYVLVHFPLTVNAESMAGYVSHTLSLLAKTTEHSPRLLFFGLPEGTNWGTAGKDIDKTHILDATGSMFATIEELRVTLSDNI